MADGEPSNNKTKKEVMSGIESWRVAGIGPAQVNKYRDLKCTKNSKQSQQAKSSVSSGVYSNAKSNGGNEKQKYGSKKKKPPKDNTDKSQ